ncbi:hypothetical protein FRC08_006815, partial [Ceratobasidium sp. 394]
MPDRHSAFCPKSLWLAFDLPSTRRRVVHAQAVYPATCAAGLAQPSRLHCSPTLAARSFTLCPHWSPALRRLSAGLVQAAYPVTWAAGFSTPLLANPRHSFVHPVPALVARTLPFERRACPGEPPAPPRPPLRSPLVSSIYRQPAPLPAPAPGHTRLRPLFVLPRPPVVACTPSHLRPADAHVSAMPRSLACVIAPALVLTAGTALLDRARPLAWFSHCLSPTLAARLPTPLLTPARLVDLGSGAMSPCRPCPRLCHHALPRRCCALSPVTPHPRLTLARGVQLPVDAQTVSIALLVTPCSSPHALVWPLTPGLAPRRHARLSIALVLT